MSGEDSSVWETYGADAAHSLGEIEQSLLALEAEPAQPTEVHRLYRALHTLKGNSAILELRRVEVLAHAAEDVVGLVRDGKAIMEPAVVDLMLSTVDTLRVAIEHVGATRSDVDESHVAEPVARVRSWLEQRGEKLSERKVPAKAVGGVMLFSDVPGKVSAPPSTTSAIPVQLGEVTIGTVPPREDSAPDAETMAMFLGLAHALLMPNGALLTSVEQARELHTVLRPSAERLGLGTIIGALDALDVARFTGQRAQLSPLARALASLESAHRAVAPGGRTFNFAELCPVTPAPPSPQPAPARAEPRAPAKAEAPRNGSEERSQVLRIDARKVSTVMDLAGEIGLACSAVTHHPELVGNAPEGFAAAAHKLEMLVRELQNEVAAMRLVPVGTVFQTMRRVVRDTARRTGKQVELVIRGEETEVDKVMVDALNDPLVHLLRNAIDHGIEAPDDRVAAGKSITGRIHLEASHQGGEVVIEVRDDGKGLDQKRILQKARERGLIAPGLELAESEVLNLIFLPGFSTKEKIDELSGRGVGMDVIKTSIEALRGRVRLASTQGKGSTVALTVPLTMAFLDAMVVSLRTQLFAIPIEKVVEVFKADSLQRARSAEGGDLLRVRKELVPVLFLDEYYEGGRRSQARALGGCIVVVQTARGRLALPVDRLLGNQPVMLKPMRGVAAHVRAAAGFGMLRTGDVALTLDCEQLHA